MKVTFPFSALTFFLFLAYLTHPGKRDETPQNVEKQDFFFFKDFNIHGTSITGSCINETPKLKECTKYTRNATCRDFETFKLRTPGLIAEAWDFSWALITGASNKCLNITVTMATSWDGVAELAEWFWDKVTSLADGIWNRVLWMTGRVWNGVTWLADGVWNGGTWLAEWFWRGLTWTGRLLVPGNYVTDGVVKFYYGYLDSHMNHIGARIAASTWQDVFYMMSAVFVMNFTLLAIYLLISCTVRFIRRLWQARKGRITVANPPPAPKKPIWRPKPKKKRRKNKNGW